MTEINWNTAPDWGFYHAIDKNGEGFWYEYKPKVKKPDTYWNQPWGRFRFNKEFNLGGVNWKETLTSRPTAQIKAK